MPPFAKVTPMQPHPTPLLADLVLIGGGHAHALVLRRWGMDPLPGVRVTLINPGPAAPYTGMLPGQIAGHYAPDEILIDLVRLARFAGARLILDRAVGIDRARREIALEGRPPLGYDLASIDIGISSDLPALAGFGAHAVAAKPLGDYAARWETFVADAPQEPQLVIIGGGIGGVELALASAHRLRQSGRAPRVSVLEQTAHPLAGIGEGARRALLAHMATAGITLLTGARAARIGAASVLLEDGRDLPADFTLSVAGARPQGWLTATGLDLHEGFVTVNPQLQSADPAIFAVGDIAHMPFAPRPKAGVFAVRQAPVLLHNLRAVLTGGRLRAFAPQRDYLKLISTGGQSAVADKFGLRLDAPLLWRWKDRIDRAFMAKFEDYPVMAAPPPAGPALRGLAEVLAERPLCGGCGAKIAAADLTAALSHLPAPVRSDVIAGAGDDAAVLAAPGGVQVISTDHLRAFTEDARLMATITANHALGDIWAMGAAPQVALAQITLPRLAPAMARAMLTEIMAAAGAVFRAAGADVVGGHSAIGAELTIGFTVTGLAGRVIAKSGARAGDRLILTKPLGTGIILAAEMALARVPGLVLGQSVAACHQAMTRSLGPAAAVLAPDATAMTDITGFGLAGHLLEILTASGCGAILDLEAVPALPGAVALAAAGQESSLAPANRAATVARMEATASPQAALLFDPQTAGGLLAALPADRAEAVLAALRANGETAAIIGEVTAGAPRIRFA